jgi:thioredoxin reductase (NADPH)
MAGGAVSTVLTLDPSPEVGIRSGPDLGAVVGMKNIDLGVQTFFSAVTKLLPGTSGGWQVLSSHRLFGARHVILATGARLRKLGVKGEMQFAKRGVSSCADCDAPRVVGRDCVVVGGGDAAFQEAAILARFARSVKILMRRTTPRARRDLVEKALGSERVELLPERRVLEIIGDREAGVTGVRVAGADGAQEHIACAGVFVFVGGQSRTALLPESVARDAEGAVLVDRRGALDLPGLWAIGAVRSGFSGGLKGAAADAVRVVDALCQADVFGIP